MPYPFFISWGETRFSTSLTTKNFNPKQKYLPLDLPDCAEIKSCQWQVLMRGSRTLKEQNVKT